MTATDMARRADQRRSQSDAKIVAAVLGIIRDQGLDAVTIDGVTARSGVAKTTIYRRYKDRFELLSDVLDRVSPPHDRHELGPSKERFIAIVRDTQALFEELFGLAAVGRILASDETLSRRWQDKIIVPRMNVFREFLAQGVRDGLLDPGVDYELLVEMIFGGMVVCSAVRGKLPADWAVMVVQTIWPLIRRVKKWERRGDRGSGP